MWSGECLVVLLLIAASPPVLSACIGSFMGCPQTLAEDSAIDGELHASENDHRHDTNISLDYEEDLPGEITEDETSYHRSMLPSSLVTLSSKSAAEVTPPPPLPVPSTAATTKSSPTAEKSEVTTAKYAVTSSSTAGPEVPPTPTTTTAGDGGVLIVILGVVSGVGIIVSAVFGILYCRERRTRNGVSKALPKQEGVRPTWRNSDEVRKMLTDDDRFVP